MSSEESENDMRVHYCHKEQPMIPSYFLTINQNGGITDIVNKDRCDVAMKNCRQMIERNYAQFSWKHTRKDHHS